MHMKKFLTWVWACCWTVVAGAQGLYPEESLHKQPPKVPAYVVFAGDTVRFDRSDLYERMDRELIAFTYMHTNSLLMLKRSDRYFKQIVPILKAERLPEDLKYLMVIESNLDPKAYSAAGAAGLWQFTRGTAKEYGLVCDDEVDERYNIEKSTLAACAYIRKAYAKYRDWFSVAASYNSGQNGITKRREDQRQTSALNLWMPEETSRYIFRMLAAKLFFQKPEAFGFHVTPDEKYPYIPPRQTVTISSGIENLTDFAERYGITYRALKEANRWLRDNKLVNKAGRTYVITIPGEG